MKILKGLSLCFIFIISEVLSQNSLEDEEGTPDSVIDETLNELEQDDPTLIEAIKNLLINPPPIDVPYNLTNDGQVPLKGQYNQVSHLHILFPKNTKGFFVDVGAFDGIIFSNTLYFEKMLGWKGILIEPNPEILDHLKTRQRRAHIFGQGVSTQTRPETVYFDASGPIGGIINDERRPSHGNEYRVSRTFRNIPIHQKTIKMQCFPLFSILMAIGNPTVNLLNLDVEGAEFKILQTIPWDKVDIHVILMDVSHLGNIFDGNLDDVEDFLSSKGFKFYKKIQEDNIYVKKDFQLPERNK